MAVDAIVLTQFPDLLDVAHENYETEGSNIEFSIDPGLEDESIILAWALMLSAYTGEEVLAFSLNDVQVEVNTTTQEVKQIFEAKNGKRSTAVLSTSSQITSSSKASSESLDLSAVSLIYARESGLCRLQTSSGVPSEHISELARQIHSFIKQVLKFSGTPAKSEAGIMAESIINPHPTSMEGPELLHRLVFHHKHSVEPALDFRNSDGSRTTLCYESLRSRSFSFANKLRDCFSSLGISNLKDKQRVIPVLIPQSAELYVALLGILEAGAAFCPLNMDAPEERVRFIIQDVAADVIVTTSDDVSRFEFITDVTFCIVDGIDSSSSNNSQKSDIVSSRPMSQAHPESNPNDWAYIMYTSGSTGQPKGVILSHLAVTQSLLAHDRHIPNFSRFLQFASPTFDVSMFEIFFTLQRGATLVGCSRGELLDNLPGMITELEIDAAELTPTVAGTLLRYREDVPSLNLLLTIGEMLTRSVIEEFGASPSKPEMLYGMYGPTEAAIHCTVQPKFATNEKVGLIGKPFDTVSAFIAAPVLSESNYGSLNILPIGQIGELVVGGPQLAHGYLNREDQTKKAFFEHPLYGMLYRTGDKARILPNRTIECLGRIQSGQIKLRGQRIELGEIEQAAMTNDSCRLAVASVIRDNLILFCLASSSISVSMMRETCRKWLLPHMMPNEILIYSSFPQLASGKVDKKALEKLYETNTSENEMNGNSLADPELVRRLCSIFKDVLGIEVNPQAEPSKAGVDSLRAIQLASEIRRQKLFNLGAVDVLRANSIEAICSHATLSQPNGLQKPSKVQFDQLRSMVLENPEIASQSSNILDILPCTSVQTAMLAETMRDSRAYCNWIEVEIYGDFTVEEVSSAFEELLNVHEILRSGFVSVEDSSVTFAHIIWKQYSDDQIRQTSDTKPKNFHIDTPVTLLRPFLVSISKSSQNITAVMEIHHALYDGWSMDLIIKDLNTLLGGSKISKRTSFRNVVEYFEELSDSPGLDESRDYWESLLENVQPNSFPEFESQHSLTKEPNLFVYKHLCKSGTLDDLPFHPQVFIQFALAYLWASYVGSNDIVLGSVSSGRAIPVDGIEDVIGPCIATLPLRIQWTSAKSVQAVMTSIQDQNLHALEHSVLSLREIRNLANLDPTESFFDVVFIWQESIESKTAHFSYARPSASADFLESKLLVEAEPQGDSVMFKCSQREENIPNAMVEIFLSQVSAIFQSLCERGRTGSLEIQNSEIGAMLDDSLLSIDSNCLNSGTPINGGLYAPLNQHVKGTTVLEDPLLRPEQKIAPIGTVGLLFCGDEQLGKSYRSKLRHLVPNSDDKYKNLAGSELLCRMLPDKKLQVLGMRDDYDIFHDRLINTNKLSEQVNNLSCVKDSRTIVITHWSRDILVTFWIPQEIEQTNGFERTNGNQLSNLPATTSYIELASQIFERLSESLPRHLMPSYILPVFGATIHDLQNSELRKVFENVGNVDSFSSSIISKCSESESGNWDKSEIERTLTQVLSEVIKVSSKNIRRTTSFFRLGLDSISAISFARKLRNGPAKFDVDVSVILRHPSVGRLASYVLKIQRIQDQEPNNVALSGDMAETFHELEKTYNSKGFELDKVRPCTPLQEGMLASSSSSAYSNHTLFEVFQPISRFKDAFSKIFKRHDIFRTCFSSTANPKLPFAQVVLKSCQAPWRKSDRTQRSIDETMAEIECSQLDAIDSMKPPFLITEICTDKRFYLLLSIHHALYDAEAMSQLLWEIEQTLKAKSLPDPPSFDSFLQEALYATYDEADNFWLKIFTNFRPQPLLSKQAHEGVANGNSRRTFTSSTTHEVPLEEIENAAREQSVTLSTLVQAAWSKVISVATGSRDICYGHVVHGRSLPIEDLERLVAPCFNTVPVRAQLTNKSTNADILQQLQRINADILAYQFMPLRRLQSKLDLDGSKLFDTLILMQKPAQKLDAAIWAERKDVGDMGLPLVCEIIPDPDMGLLRIQFHADRSFLSESDCKDLSNAFKSSLGSCVKTPYIASNYFGHFGIDRLRTRENGANGPNEKKELMERNVSPDSVEYFHRRKSEPTIQKALADFLSLPLERINRDSSIFRLGVDSIMAIQIAKVLRNQGVAISAQTVMEGRSPAGIAALIENGNSLEQRSQGQNESKFDFLGFYHRYRATICEATKLRYDQIAHIRPCTQIQAGMLSQYLTSEGKMYLNHFLYELSDSIDIKRLYQAWEMVFEQHEMLRTGFIACEDSTYPFVMITHNQDKSELPWNTIDVTDQANGEAAMKKVVQASRKRFANKALNNLQYPPWEINVFSVKSDSGREYFLHLSMLHALYDAESLKMILDDVEKTYHRTKYPLPRNIDPLLSDILSNTIDETSQREFWKSTLEDVSINRFPNLNPLQVEQREIRSTTYRIDDLQTLLEGCRCLGVTLQAVLQVVWARLLAEYLAESDIVFGMVLAGRESEGADEIAFPSTNTVPCRIQARDDSKAMLHDVMNYNVAVRKFQHASLPQISRWAGFQESSIFDTLLIFQPSDAEVSSEVFWRTLDEQATVEYPVSIEVTQEGVQALRISLVFFDDVLPLEQANILSRQFVQILKNVVLDEQGKYGTPYDDLSLLSKLDPATPEIPSDAQSLHDFVHISAQLYPDDAALEFVPTLDDSKSLQWTYSNLNSEGNKIANLILDHGSKPRSLIAVCFDKCAEASFTILGVLKAGCAYVALDPTAPNSRKSFILEDSEASMLLTTSNIANDMALDSNIKILCVDTLESSILKSYEPKTASQVAKSDPCYCLYTSGSSGTPKGCIITHENAVQAMLAFQKIFAGRWEKSSRWLQFASFHFDVSVLEQFWSWSVGICVVSTPRDVLFSDLAGVLNRLRITHIDLTPSLARLITPEEVPTLCRGIFITGGELLKQEVLDAWGPIGVIHNGYGPTECTIGCTMYPRVPARGKASNIGWQFENVGTYVFKPGTTQLIPRGGVGELCVSGKLVGKEYLNRPDLTEESFAYIPEYNERVYHTKDLVRMLYDGSFEFLGRNDDQVKLRGQRLELGEINSAMTGAHDQAQEVNTIIVKRDTNQSEQLVSFVAVGAQHSHMSIEDRTRITSELREVCETKLPGYMIPSDFILLENIPLTANNKIDSKRLKAIFEESINQGARGADIIGSPTIASEDENILVKAISTFLSIPPDAVTPGSNLFQLGLDSISAFGFARVLENRGYENARAAAIMKHKTIRDLAAALNQKINPIADESLTQARHEIGAFQRKNKSTVMRNLGVSQHELESIWPCTSLQHGMIAKALQDDSKPYFNTMLYEIDTNAIEELLAQTCTSPSVQETAGNMNLGSQINGDSAALQSHLCKAMDATLESTSILRTTFASTHEGYAQAVLRKRIPNAYRICKLQPTETIQEAMQRYRSAWLTENEEYFKLPLQACFVACDSSTKLYLILNIFHGLYDATSLPLLLENLVTNILEPQKPLQGSSFHEILPFGPLQKHQGSKEFWKNHLANSVFRPLISKENDASIAYSTKSLYITGLSTLENVRRKLNVTHQALVQAAWTAVFHEWSEFTNTFGMVVSGRSINIPNPDLIIGPMFNTIPFSMNIATDDTWRSLVCKCHDFNMSVIAYHHTPLRDIQKWCGNSGRSALFDALFVFQKLPATNSSKIFEELDSTADADYPLAFEAEQIGSDSLNVTLVSRSEVADEQAISEILQRFKSVFNEILNDTENSVSQTIQMSKITVRNNANGIGSSSTPQIVTSNDKFEWTDLALLIRQTLAKISATDTESIGARTSIFQLGLDSIDAIKLSSAMKANGVNLSVSAILRQQCIENMIKVVENDLTLSPNHIKGQPSRLEAHKEQLENLKSSESEAILPATPLQESIMLEMVSSGLKNYFNHDILRLKQTIDIDKFRNAWKMTYESRNILRTSFCEVEDPGLPYAFAQVINKKASLDWEDVKVKHFDDLEGLVSRITSDMATKMDIDITPRTQKIPFKLTCVTTGDGLRYLILSMSHALYDGWSLNLLHQDVFDAYCGNLTNRPENSLVLNKILEESSNDAKNFWYDSLSEYHGCQFPVSNPFPTDENIVHRLEKASKLRLDKVQEFCKAQNVGMQALGHLCWSLVLASHTKSLDVGFGVVLSGRDDEESQQVMFPTMNTVVARCVISGSRSEMLREAQSNVASLMQYQFFPLREVSTLTGVPGHALFNTLFIYQKRPPKTADVTELYESTGGSSSVEYPVCVEMEAIDEKLMWRTACSNNALSLAGAEQILEHLDQVLDGIMSWPEAPVVQFHGKSLSVCGLTEFEESPNSAIGISINGWGTNDGQVDHDMDLDSSEKYQQSKKSVFETLSFVSKVPETQIRGNDTIYHLGLDSISLIKVSSALRQNGIHISVRDMLTAGTVTQIISAVSEIQPRTLQEYPEAQTVLNSSLEGLNTNEILSRIRVQENDIQSIIPATPAQVFFLSHWQSTNGVLFYSTFQYYMGGDIEISTLRKAWAELVKQNEILRTVFVGTGNTDIPILQIVLDSAQESYVDLTQDQSLVDSSTSPMPPVRLAVKKLRRGVWIGLQIHHALYDAVSLPLLFMHLEQLYRDHNSGSKQTSNENFVELVAQIYSRHKQDAKRDFWTNYLGSSATVGVREDQLRAQQIDLSERTSIYRPQMFTDLSGLTENLRKRGIGLQSFFLAIVASTYARTMGFGMANSDQPIGDVILGMYLANRSHNLSSRSDLQTEDLTKLAAPTLNLVPLKVTSPLAKSIYDCANQIQEDLPKISRFEHASVGLWEIDEWTGIKIDCFVNFLTLPENDSSNGEQSTSSEGIPDGKIEPLDDHLGDSFDQDLTRGISADTAMGLREALEQNAVRETYIPSCDIEAAVRKGAIDVGIFGPAGILNAHTAGVILDELRQGLKKGTGV